MSSRDKQHGSMLRRAQRPQRGPVIRIPSCPPSMDMSWRTSRVFDRDVWRRSGLAFWNVFAEHALVAFDPPFPVGAILKPLGDTRLGMNLAIHHVDAGLVTVGDNLFQADLVVAQ